MIDPRCILQAFKVLAFQGSNESDFGGKEVTLDLEQRVQMGVSVPDVEGAAPIRGVVRIELRAKVTAAEEPNKEPVTCQGTYEGRFQFMTGVTAKAVEDAYKNDDYQYALVSQVFPLAMQHLKLQLSNMGVDNHFIPLGT